VGKAHARIAGCWSPVVVDDDQRLDIRKLADGYDGVITGSQVEGHIDDDGRGCAGGDDLSPMASQRESPAKAVVPTASTHFAFLCSHWKGGTMPKQTAASGSSRAFWASQNRSGNEASGEPGLVIVPGEARKRKCPSGHRSCSRVG
jgi:hypothetical protein